MEAEIITIGTEILLGEIVDTNTAHIARALRSIGLDLRRTTTVGDNAERIAQAVREAMGRSQAVITTGGLGPTVDDMTREGIARAVGVETEYRPELWRQVEERFARFGRAPTENNRRQAFIPRGAIALENPVGTAPGFIVEAAGSCVIALPGVPSEMEHLLATAVLPYLKRRLGLEAVIVTRVLRTAGEGESWIDERIADLEELTNPTVGISAHPARVDIRITAKAQDVETARSMIGEVERRLRERLGEAVYGVDEESLEAAALAAVARAGWQVVVVESGTGGALAAGLAAHDGPFAGGWVAPEGEPPGEVATDLARRMESAGAQVGLGVMLRPGAHRQEITLLLRAPGISEDIERSYGGPLPRAPAWAASLALELLRRRLVRMEGG